MYSKVLSYVFLNLDTAYPGGQRENHKRTFLLFTPEGGDMNL
jgi:hypothetical protein